MRSSKTGEQVKQGQKQVISKKKKGLRRNPKAFSGRNQKFKRFFQPKTGDLQKQKKRSSPKFEGFFWPKSEI